jgi:hypothetical protein
LAEQGIFGLITFISFLGYIFYQYARAFVLEKDKQQRFILLCWLMMLSGVVLFQLFSTSYYNSRTWLPIGVGLAAIEIYRRKS